MQTEIHECRHCKTPSPEVKLENIGDGIYYTLCDSCEAESRERHLGLEFNEE